MQAGEHDAPRPIEAANEMDLFDFYFKTITIVPVVILRVAKRSRRIQTPHGFRDYARNDWPSK